MYGAGLVLFLIIMSGFIAYLGDQIGMKIGKRRLSLFGLRPRHTSILITIMTGMVIAVFSLTLLMAASSVVRETVFNIQEMLTHFDSLSREVQEKDIQLKSMQEEIQEKADRLTLLEEQRQISLYMLEDLQREYDSLAHDLKTAETDISFLQESRDTLLAIKEELTRRVHELDEQEQELRGTISQLYLAIQELEAFYSERLAAVSQKMHEISTGELAYLKGQLVYSNLLPGGDGLVEKDQESFQILKNFLGEARDLAMEMGVRDIALYEENFLETAVALWQSNEPLIVRIVAQQNTPRGEQLLASIQFFENYRVYSTGQVIASIQLEAEADPGTMEMALIDLLRLVNMRAREDGILPDAYGMVGSFQVLDMVQIIQEIRGMPGKVEVQVVAIQDIWRNETLSTNLEYRVVAHGG